MAVASRPDTGGQLEIEAADDFVFSTQASLTEATFTGLVPTGANIMQVVVEIYRVFPNDSQCYGGWESTDSHKFTFGCGV